MNVTEVRTTLNEIRNRAAIDTGFSKYVRSHPNDVLKTHGIEANFIKQISNESKAAKAAGENGVAACIFCSTCGFSVMSIF